MARFFDAQAALAEIQGSPIHPIHPTPEAETGRNSTNGMHRIPPDLESFEERAAIIELAAEAGLSMPTADPCTSAPVPPRGNNTPGRCLA